MGDWISGGGSVREIAKMNKKLVLLYVAALAVAIVIGYIDTHSRTDDGLPMVLILLVGTFLFGLAQPALAWQWALIIGLGVPGAHFIGLMFGYHPPRPVQPNVLATFLALIPAFAGAYLGALGRVILRSAVA